ncbi:MAG: KamA family radical SAM protein [Candidatus Omnitrophica bacterium]|nr:KamA family radical SAM protein [Candidatus Omnitrophota bacterium]
MNPLDLLQKRSDGALSRKFSRELLIPLNEREQEILSYFKHNDQTDWEDWRWQLRNRIRTRDVLAPMVPLTEQEEKGLEEGAIGKLTMSIPPYFASLIDPDNPKCPIRLQSIPQGHELTTSKEEMRDPCGEDKHSPVHGLVHRYPDRVLFLVNEMCAMYCRYCTRSRMVGDGERTLSTETYKAAFDYIRAHKEIRDVLISGGDPLTLSDKVLEYIIQNLKSIDHVEFVRIGTRIPVTLPQRVTPELVDMLKNYSPIWMSIHFNHPSEITDRVKAACNLIADSGIPMGSQTVLLKDVNDDPAVMKSLMHELLKIRVRPYYIYQCDPIVGSKHFRTPVSTGLRIMEQLRGHTTGYAVPTYVIDGPGGGGKIPISPEYIVERKKDRYVLRNYSGETFEYFDPQIDE